MTTSSDDSNFFVIPNVGDEVADIEKNVTDPKEKLLRKETVMQTQAQKNAKYPREKAWQTMVAGNNIAPPS